MSQLWSSSTGIDELMDARGLGVWHCARGDFIDGDKCWTYCVLESKTVLPSMDEVLTYFSLTRIDSLRLTVFILPLKVVLITLLLLVGQNSRLFHPTRNLLSTHRTVCHQG